MITSEQKEVRRRYIGSSDIASLFTDGERNSLDPFKTSADTWASKVFEFEEKQATKLQTRGNRYESGLLDFVKHELGCTVVSGSDETQFICKDHPIFACHLDGFTTSPCLFKGELTQPPVIIEAKTTGMASEWGEPGTDEIPMRVILQVQQQMLCTGWDKAIIAVLMGKFSLTEELYFISRNEAIINAIIEKGEQFWNDYVLTKTPPPDSQVGNIALFKRIVREPETYADVKPELITQWEEAKQSRLDIQKIEENAFAQILLELKDAEGVKLPDNRTFTYFKQKGKTIINEKKLQTDYPEVYQDVSRENFYRVPRIQKGK